VTICIIVVGEITPESLGYTITTELLHAFALDCDPH
jgi:hypothetical protein